MSVTEASTMTVLASVCRRKRWALLLRTDGENTLPRGYAGAVCFSRPTCLDVVELADRGDTRRQRIVAGDLIVRVVVTDARDLPRAAGDALELLGRYGLLNDAA